MLEQLGAKNYHVRRRPGCLTILIAWFAALFLRVSQNSPALGHC